jgi:hypothetical protein
MFVLMQVSQFYDCDAETMIVMVVSIDDGRTQPPRLAVQSAQVQQISPQRIITLPLTSSDVQEQ